MNRRSPHTITYKDILQLVERTKTACQVRHDGAKDRGTTNLDALTHDLETAKALHRLLKKYEPGQQIDLYALFEQVK